MGPLEAVQYHEGERCRFNALCINQEVDALSTVSLEKLACEPV